jgi:hypothetical protein
MKKPTEAGGKLIACLAHPLTLKVEAICSSDTSVEFQRSTRCYIPEGRTLHDHRCENFRHYRAGDNLQSPRASGRGRALMLWWLYLILFD